jgi:Zn finger protein HypA/HybF involved in hydrogenase expression
MEKQIEEMAKIMLEESQKANVEPVLEIEGKEIVLGEIITKILDNILEQAFIPFLAEILYKQGYTKQEQGEWKMVKYPLTKCSNCDVVRNCEKDTGWKYCPHCGAKMKGN